MRWSDHRAQLEAERDAVASQRKQLAKALTNAPAGETGDAQRAALRGVERELDDRESDVVSKWNACGDFTWQEDPIYLAMVENRNRLFAATSESWRVIRLALANTDPHNFAKIDDLNRDEPMPLDNIRDIGSLVELQTLWTLSHHEQAELLASNPIGEDDDKTADLVRAKAENLVRLANLLQTLGLLSMLAQGEEDLRAKFLPG